MVKIAAGQQINAVANLKEQVNAMRYNNRTDYQIGKDIAEGGSLLIYNDEISEFLNSLDINDKNKHFEPEQSFDLYAHLMAREIAKIVNR